MLSSTAAQGHGMIFVLPIVIERTASITGLQVTLLLVQVVIALITVYLLFGTRKRDQNRLETQQDSAGVAIRKEHSEVLEKISQCCQLVTTQTVGGTKSAPAFSKAIKNLTETRAKFCELEQSFHGFPQEAGLRALTLQMRDQIDTYIGSDTQDGRVYACGKIKSISTELTDLWSETTSRRFDKVTPNKDRGKS